MIPVRFLLVHYFSSYRIVTKYRNDPLKMELISKHFYSERVFDDSTSDHPKLRWRYRSFFGDNVAHGQKTHDQDSNDNFNSESHTDSYTSARNDSKRDSDIKITNYLTKQVVVSILTHLCYW